MSDIVCIKMFQHEHEAQMAQSVLEGEGVPSIVSADDLGGMRPDFRFNFSGVRLLVKEEDRKRALEILGPES